LTNVFRICENCNKEFRVELEVSPFGVGDISTMQICPHCEGKNNIWIRVVEDCKPQKIEDEEAPEASAEYEIRRPHYGWYEIWKK